jgi:predicted DNA-binding protein
MPAKNPRVMVVMERPLFYLVKKMASRNGVSLSTEVRDLVRHSLEDVEDSFWAKEAEARLRAPSRKAPIRHADFWKKTGL